MKMRSAAAVLAISWILALPLSLQSQEPTDTLARVTGRTLEQLVEELPGEPMELAELVRIAVERNLGLEMSRTVKELADADLMTEEGLFDPQLSLGWSTLDIPDAEGRGGSYQAQITQALPWGTALGLGVRGQKTAGDQGAYSDLNLTLDQPLLEGFGTLNAGVRSARALQEAAAATLRRSRDTLVAGVELSYWSLAEVEATQAVLQRSLEIADALLFRNQQLAERSLVPEVDVITARSGVALRRSGLISTRLARVNAAEALVFLVWGEGATEQLAGMRDPVKAVPAGPVMVPAIPEDREVAEEAALERRYDVLAARARLRSAEEYRREATRAVLPSLNLQGGLSSSAFDTGYQSSLERLGNRPTWSLGLTLSHPLFNRRDRGVGMGAELMVELRRLELVMVENGVRLQVRSALRALEAGRERLAAAEEAASFARAQLEAERRRLDLGLGDSFRLLETEENAVQAELEWVQARFDLARAATLYRLAVGGS